MARPVIALLTDFGTADHYVGSMKGVILGICPEAALVDITHDISPHDVLEAALELEASRGAFPDNTVFLTIVDPGVGSGRRGLAAASGRHRFVAPDNGILTTILRDVPAPQVVELSDRRFARSAVSRTFEGRDRFAPAAAWLAAGVELSSLGPAVFDPVMLEVPRPVVAGEAVTGVVLRVDRFGNIVTNIDRRSIARAARGGSLKVRIGEWQTTRFVQTYTDLEAGEIGALFGSRDCLEVSAREASAAARVGVRRGDNVEITWMA